MVAYLRRVLRVKETESVFLYVNSSFAPALDEVVGNLHRVSFPDVVVLMWWREEKSANVKFLGVVF